VSGSPPDGLLVEECASADGFGAADATPGASAIPETAAAVRVHKTDFNIGSPYRSRRSSITDRLRLVARILLTVITGCQVSIVVKKR
jgi:hypothetical protein